MTRFLTIAIFSLSLAGAAHAEPAVYEIPVSGVVCGGTAAYAEAAVRRAGEIQSVRADAETHTVLARFDDDTTSLDAIVESLRASGLESGEAKRIN